MRICPPAVICCPQLTNYMREFQCMAEAQKASCSLKMQQIRCLWVSGNCSLHIVRGVCVPSSSFFSILSSPEWRLWTISLCQRSHFSLKTIFHFHCSLVSTHPNERSRVQPQPADTFYAVGGEAETSGQDILNISGHCKNVNAPYTCKE